MQPDAGGHKHPHSFGRLARYSPRPRDILRTWVRSLSSTVVRLAAARARVSEPTAGFANAGGRFSVDYVSRTRERFSASHVSAQLLGRPGLNKRAEEYRRLARECLMLAGTGVTPEGHSSLVEMARVWIRLADEQDIATTPLIRPSESTQTDTPQQQQQQVQPKKAEQ
jgi:hypothetical protein